MANESPELPIRGTITNWQPDDSIGRIRLSSGEEIRFGHSACVGLRPALGAEVWVVEVAPHPLGGLRAKVLNATGAVMPDRATAALAAHREREKLRPAVDAEVEAIKAECNRTLSERAQPWDVARASGAPGIVLIEALRARLTREEAADVIGRIAGIVDGARADDLRLLDLEWADTWQHLEVWTDPAFVAFAASDTDHLGLFAHPAAMARGESAPVVFRSHAHDPIFAWVAESAQHFVRMVEALEHGEEDVEHLRGEPQETVMALLAATRHEEAFEDVERGDVHALFWSGARVLELAAADRLEARYRERSWTFPLASLDAQRALAGWQDRIDAARAKLG